MTAYFDDLFKLLAEAKEIARALMLAEPWVWREGMHVFLPDDDGIVMNAWPPDEEEGTTWWTLHVSVDCEKYPARYSDNPGEDGRDGSGKVSDVLPDLTHDGTAGHLIVRLFTGEPGWRAMAHEGEFIVWHAEKGIEQRGATLGLAVARAFLIIAERRERKGR